MIPPDDADGDHDDADNADDDGDDDDNVDRQIFIFLKSYIYVFIDFFVI